MNEMNVLIYEVYHCIYVWMFDVHIMYKCLTSIYESMYECEKCIQMYECLNV